MQLYAMAVPATAIAPLKLMAASVARIPGLKDADASTRADSGARKVIAATSDANFGIKGVPATDCF
jgi:hypothetical protein